MEFLAANTQTKVVIGVAPYEDVMELKSCLFEALSNSDMKIDLQSLSVDADIDLAQFLKAAMDVAGSREVRKALMKCLERCTYNGRKIVPGLFDELEPRQDFYEIAFNCIKVNLSPFFVGLGSRLKTIIPLTAKEPLES